MQDVEPGRRLRALRKEAGVSVKVIAKRTGLSESGIRAMENGQNGVTADNAARIGQVLRSSAAYILFGQGEPRKRTIPVVGYVGAASEFFGFDDHEMGGGMDEVEPPPGVPDNAVAVIVRGDSGYPAIRDGMTLIYWNRLEDPSSVEGEDCFVRLTDGRTLVKILERGTVEGRWTLVSMNAATPPIRNVEIEWAAPIEVRLRRNNWKAA